MAGTGLGTPYDLRESRALTTDRIPRQTGIEQRPDLTAKQQVTAWNLRRNVGTPVVATVTGRDDDYEINTETSSAAHLLAGTARVHVHGVVVSLPLDRVRPADATLGGAA